MSTRCEILLPQNAGLNWVESLVWPEGSDDVSVGFAQATEHVEPVTLSMFSAALASSADRPWTWSQDRFGQYAYQIGLGHVLARHSLDGERSVGKLRIRGPARVPTHLEVHGEISPWKTRLPPPAFEMLTWLIDDLCANVFDHAGTRFGGFLTVSVNETRVRVAIADRGRGVVADLRQNRPGAAELDDVAAVTLAVDAPGVIGSTVGNNAGWGLKVARSLAASTGGAFWLYTGAVVARSSSSQPDVEVARVSGNWPGTAVSVVFDWRRVGDFQQSMAAIRHALQGQGPAYALLTFQRRLSDAKDLAVIEVSADDASMAFDRERARRLSALLRDALNRGRVAVDFSALKAITQGFAHSLLVDSFRQDGAGAAQRMVFVACTPQVTEMVRYAANFGLAADRR
jgi:hypothetical protein